MPKLLYLRCFSLSSLFRNLEPITTSNPGQLWSLNTEQYEVICQHIRNSGTSGYSQNFNQCWFIDCCPHFSTPEKINLSQIWAWSLFTLRVTVAVLIPARLARRTISTFALVLPVAKIKQYVMSFINLELNRSEGLWHMHLWLVKYSTIYRAT